MNLTKQPLVSVIIPACNSAKTIEETISSVANQIYQNWEIIIVDDTSTDATSEICKILCSKDKRINYFIRDNELKKGGSVCRNLGLKFSKGEYIIFLDSDDLLADFCIKQRVEVMLTNPNLDFAVFKVECFNSIPGDLNQLAVNFDDRHPLSGFLEGVYPLPWHTTSPIWKKESIVKIGGFNENYPRLQDHELHTRALSAYSLNYELCSNSPVDSFYRQLQKSYTEQDISIKFLDGLYIFLEDYIPKIKEYDSNNNTTFIKNFKKSFWNILNGIYPSISLRGKVIHVLNLGKKHSIINTFDYCIIMFILNLKILYKRFHRQN